MKNQNTNKKYLGIRKRGSFKTLMAEIENIVAEGLEKKEKAQLIRIRENALEHITRHFNNKSIYIYIDGIISGRNTIHKAKCEYDIQKRFFYHI